MYNQRPESSASFQPIQPISTQALIRLMEEILHHLECLKPCDKLPTSTGEFTGFLPSTVSFRVLISLVFGFAECFRQNNCVDSRPVDWPLLRGWYIHNFQDMTMQEAEVAKDHLASKWKSPQPFWKCNIGGNASFQTSK